MVFCEAFGLLEEVGEVAGDRLRPRLQGHQALEIAGVILGIRCSLITWGRCPTPPPEGAGQRTAGRCRPQS